MLLLHTQCVKAGFMIGYLIEDVVVLMRPDTRVVEPHATARLQLFVQTSLRNPGTNSQYERHDTGEQPLPGPPSVQLSSVAAQPPFQWMSLSEKATIYERSAHGGGPHCLRQMFATLPVILRPPSEDNMSGRPVCGIHPANHSCAGRQVCSRGGSQGCSRGESLFCLRHDHHVDEGALCFLFGGDLSKLLCHIRPTDLQL